MKKLVYLLCFIVVCFFLLKRYVPVFIASSLTSDSESSVIPEKIAKKVDVVKTKVDDNVRKLPELMKNANLSYDDIMIMIDKSDPDEFITAYESLKNSDWLNENEAYDIAMDHISIEGYDLEMFRSTFVENVSTNKIKQMINIIEDNELISSISIPLAKATAKQILQSKKQFIVQELEKVNATQQ